MHEHKRLPVDLAPQNGTRAEGGSAIGGVMRFYETDQDGLATFTGYRLVNDPKRELKGQDDA